MGPSERAGKNDSTPTISTVPTSRTTNVMPDTGNVPALSGTTFFPAKLPASASTGTMNRNRPISMATASTVLYQGVLVDSPAKALPLLATADEKAYRISLKPWGPALESPASPHRLATAHAENTITSRTRISTASALTFTSYDRISLPRYSGVRPTMSPARNTVRITKTSIP